MERLAPFAAMGPDAEARHATVVKCDIVGSTQTKRLLDLEGQLAFQRGCEQVTTEIAARYNAHIERFEGDGALIVLGLPQPQEDAAESAVRMGLDLIAAMRDAKLLPGVRLQLRVGIASGLIAVIKRPSNPKGDSIAGMTIEMAERLRAIAGPEQVVVADATRRLAGAFFRYEDLGDVGCKGFETGVRACRVAGTSHVLSRFEARRFECARGKIIGRADALCRLAEAWTASLAGNGRAIYLVGDAGLGKSRLAQAALDAAVRDGAVTLTIHCTPSTTNTPLFPISVLLRSMVSATPSCSDAEKHADPQRLLRRLLPDPDVEKCLALLSPLFGIEAAAPQADTNPAELRDRTIATLARVMTGFSNGAPLVIVCEDLHWADHTTAQVLSRLPKEIGCRRALLIVTARLTAENLPLDIKAFTTITLEPLNHSESTELVWSLAKGTALADEVVRRIVDRCEGVPLVLEELTRSTLEAASRPDHLMTEPAERDVPAPLQLVVQSRLGRWPNFAPIVQSASVIGREFSLQLLETILRAGKQDITNAIDVLVREGLLLKEGATGDRARFKHAMICDAVYNTLLGGDRRRLHSAIADVLSCDFKGTPEAAADVIAEHLRKADRYSEAIELRLAESARTAAKGAYVETEGHCLAALTLLDRLPDPAQRKSLHLRILLQLGVALTGRYGYSAPAVEEVYRRAHEMCGDSAEAEILYPIIRGRAGAHLLRGNHATAYDFSVQGLKLADESGRPEFRIDALSMLCYTNLYFGRLEDCCGWIERCLELYRAERGHCLTYPAPHDAGTAVLALLPTVAWLLGDSQAAEKAVCDALAHVEFLDRDFDRAFMHGWIAGVGYTQRRYVEALEHAAIMTEISQRRNYQLHYGHATLMSLLSHCAMRADPEAVAKIREVCLALAREGVGMNAPYFLWGLARGYARIGDLAAAREMLAEGLRHAEATGETRMNAELLILRAELESDAEALQTLRHASARAEEHGDVATALRANAALVLRKDRDTAQGEYASATLAMLDGRQNYPAEADWMRQRLNVPRCITNV